MRRSLTVLVVCLGLIPAALPAVAMGAPDRPVHLALGDSQAFGIGTPRPDKLGYAAMLHRWLTAVDCREGEAGCPGLELVDLTVPGAETGDLIADQLPAAIQLITQRNGDDDPDNDVIYVTLTIGGNDLNHAFGANCLEGLSVDCINAVSGAFVQASGNLGQIMGTLRAVAGPDTRIVVSTYDNPFPTCVLADFAGFADVILEGDPGVSIGFNDVIRGVAAATDSDVADMYGRLSDDDWVGGDDCTHPDISGYHEMAETFLGVLD